MTRKTENNGSRSDEVAEALHQAAEGEARDVAVHEAVEHALTDPAKTFNTHSNALAGRLIAEERALIEIVADIDAKIADLQAQRTDAMLAHSMISHALGAGQRGRE